MCFCVYSCTDTVYHEKGQNQAKMDKTEHEIWKEQKKPRPGKNLSKWIIFMFKMSKLILESNHIAKMLLDKNLQNQSFICKRGRLTKNLVNACYYPNWLSLKNKTQNEFSPKA